MKYNKKKLLERLQKELTFEELFEVFEKQRQVLADIQQIAPEVYLTVLSLHTRDKNDRAPAYTSGIAKVAHIVGELENASDLEERLKPSPN